MAEELTYMTGPHLSVIRHLERKGFGLMEEIEFPPYRVDIYLPKYHAVVEVDGPTHSDSADRKRDRDLFVGYSLYVFHVPAVDADKPHRWMSRLRDMLSFVRDTRDERYEKAAMRAPWL